MKYNIFAILCLVGLLDIKAQGITEVYAQDTTNNKVDFIVDIRNYNFFDNREVNSPYQKSQTLFGSYLGADLGLKYGNNSVSVGVNLIKDFGTSGLSKNDLTLYYHYDNGRFSGALCL